MIKRYSAGLLFFMVMVSATAAMSSTTHVATNGANISPFDTWDKAATNIQSAVNVCAVSGTVWVSNGTYYLNSQVAIASNNYITIRSVNGAASTIVNGNYPNTTNRCFYVSRTGTVIDGFTITNGYANDMFGAGSGVSLGGAAATVKNCIIAGNISSNYGGGVYSSSSGGTVSNCVIIGNRALAGGGIHSAGRIQGCIISNNWADSDGGGVRMNGESMIENCFISDNECNHTNTSSDGGGVYIFGQNYGIFSSTITNNRAYDGGGIFQYSSSSCDISNCVISGNSAVRRGGGLRMSGTNNTIANCLIMGNSVGTNMTCNGGGLYISGNSTVYSCTISSNRAQYGGGIAMSGSNHSIINCIIYDNIADAAIYRDIDYYSGVPINYSCTSYTNDYSGIGNTTNNPQFTNAAAGNYRLSTTSPCINTGTNISWMFNALDLDGNPRIMGGITDMGAYEYDASNTLFVLPSMLTNTITEGQTASSNTFEVWGTGEGAVFYSLSTDASWLAVYPTSGNSTGEHDAITIIYNTSNTSAGTDTGVVTVSSVTATNSPQTMTVLMIINPVSPTITLNPQSQTNNPGESVTFRITATGTSPLYYQWQKNSMNISGVVSTNYVIASVQETDEGNYQCVVTNMAGAVTSAVATLTVNDLPSAPTGISASDGIYTDKIVIAWSVAEGASGYKVLRSISNDVTAATSTNLVSGSSATNFDDWAASQGVLYYYWVAATNGAGTTMSGTNDTGFLELPPPLTLSASSGIYTGKVGMTWVMVNGATGYEVYRNTSNSSNGLPVFAGTITANYDDTNVTVGVDYYYWVKATNSLSVSGFSAGSSGYAAEAPSILTQLQSQTRNPGESVSFEVSASGTRLGYQWQKNSTNIANAIASIYTIGSVAEGDEGAYRYLVTNLCGSTLSAEANLTITDVGTLAAPVQVRASDGTYTNMVQVTWTVVSGASFYQVWRAAANNSAAAVSLGNATLSSYDDNSSAVRSATMFYYWVKALNSVTTSDFSNVDSGFCRMSTDPEIISGQPVVGDYDGDGRADPAVYDLTSGRLFAWLSSAGYFLVNPVTSFQVSVGDLPVTGDFDGDRLADPGVFNCATGSWYIWLSSAGYYRVGPVLCGLDANDIPIPADYDGDQKTDLAVYQASSGGWYVWISGAGYIKVGPFPFHQSSADIPAPGQFDVGLLADPAVYQQASGAWYIWLSNVGYLRVGPITLRTTDEHLPVPADYDGDGLCDPAAYVPFLGKWRMWMSGSGYALTEMELR